MCFFLFCFCQSSPWNCLCAQSLIYSNLILFTIQLHCFPKLLKTHEWVTQFPSVTCSFIITNMGTAVYFEAIPHTLCCCQKCSPEHQMCIKPSLKIVPNKCSAYSSFEKHLAKPTVSSCFRNLFSWFLFCISDRILKTYISSVITGAESHWQSKEAVKSWKMHNPFWSRSWDVSTVTKILHKFATLILQWADPESLWICCWGAAGYW